MKEQFYWNCPVLKLGNVKTTTTRCRRWIAACADAPVSRSGWCLVCHFAAVAADEFQTCGQYKDAAAFYLARKHYPRSCFYAVIPPALVRASTISLHRLHLSPDYGRVTTALRLVVTRPLPAWQHVRQALPVTQVALVCIWQPSLRTECISLLHNRPHKSQSRQCLSRRRVVSLLCQLHPPQMPARNCLPDIA